MELLFWLLLVLINCSGNAITTWMDANRSGAPSMEWWEPWVWEFSSGLVWLLLLVPAIVWFSRRWPLHMDNWRRRLPWYLLASVPISLLHVLAMFGLRMLAYALVGERYQVGSWLDELLYEYLKDVRTYAAILFCIDGYRFLLRRLQGEAQLLAEGLALQVAVAPNVEQVACQQQAERAARKAGLGLWRQSPAIAAAQVERAGFALLGGRVSKVERNRAGAWIELDDSVVLHVAPKVFALFPEGWLDELKGRRVEARGWVLDRSRRGNLAAGQLRWMLPVSAPQMVQTQP